MRSRLTAIAGSALGVVRRCYSGESDLVTIGHGFTSEGSSDTIIIRLMRTAIALRALVVLIPIAGLPSPFGRPAAAAVAVWWLYSRPAPVGALPGLRARVWSDWQATLALIGRERLQSGINLLPEMVVHLCKS